LEYKTYYAMMVAAPLPITVFDRVFVD